MNSNQNTDYIAKCIKTHSIQLAIGYTFIVISLNISFFRQASKSEIFVRWTSFVDVEGLGNAAHHSSVWDYQYAIGM